MYIRLILLGAGEVPDWDFVKPDKVAEFIEKENSESFLSLGEQFQDVQFDRHKWLNMSIKHIWRSMRAAVEDVILNHVWPEVRNQLKDLPLPISLELYSLTLGVNILASF